MEVSVGVSLVCMGRRNCVVGGGECEESWSVADAYGLSAVQTASFEIFSTKVRVAIASCPTATRIYFTKI